MAIDKHNMPPTKKNAASMKSDELAQNVIPLKSSLRAEFKAKRKTCVPELSEQINRSLLKLIDRISPTICAGYYAINNELSALSTLTALAERSTILALPVVTEPDHPLIFKQWQPGDRLQQGAFKIAEPLPKMPNLVPDCIIVPLLAFDSNGFRLGYGGGFYDRTLAEVRQKKPHLRSIGIGYDAQKSANPLPIDQYDQKLDYIVTEKEIVDFTTHI